jgi:hypothetical protein
VERIDVVEESALLAVEAERDAAIRAYEAAKTETAPYEIEIAREELEAPLTPEHIAYLEKCQASFAAEFNPAPANELFGGATTTDGET